MIYSLLSNLLTRLVRWYLSFYEPYFYLFGCTLKPNFVSADCPAGQYPDPSNTSICIDCAVGFYKETSGAMECTQCAVGLATATTGVDSQDLCLGK